MTLQALQEVNVFEETGCKRSLWNKVEEYGGDYLVVLDRGRS